MASAEGRSVQHRFGHNAGLADSKLICHDPPRAELVVFGSSEVLGGVTHWSESDDDQSLHPEGMSGRGGTNGCCILKGCQPRKTGRHSELASIPSGCKSNIEVFAPGVSRTLNPRLIADIPSGSK